MNIGVKVLWITRYDYEPGWGLASHQHGFFQMIYILAGSGSFRLDGDQFGFGAHDLILIKPNQEHGLSAASLVKTFDVKFRADSTGFKNQLVAAESRARLDEHRRLCAIFERIREEGERRDAFYQDMCGSLLSEVLLLYLRKQTARPTRTAQNVEYTDHLKDSYAREALAFIRKNYMRHITVAEIATALRCSERTLRIHCRAQFGQGPLRVLQHHRIEQAKKLMESPGRPLKWVADAVGFKDIHHFTRTFTETEGMSPGAWRRRHLEGVDNGVSIDPRFVSRLQTVRHQTANA